MRGFARAAAVAATSVIALSTAQAGPPPAELYGRLPAVSGVAISPDGSKLVFGLHSGDTSGMLVLSTEGGKQLGGGRVADDQRLRGIGWAQDDIASYVVSQTIPAGLTVPFGYYRKEGGPKNYEFFRSGTLTLTDGKLHYMLDNEIAKKFASRLPLYAPVDSDPGFGRVLAPISPSVPRLGVYRVNLATGNGELAQSFDGNTADVVYDRHGSEYARTAWDKDENADSWHIFIRDGDHERQLHGESADDGLWVNLDGLLADGRLARVGHPGKIDLAALQAIDPKTGDTEIVFQTPHYDVDAAVEDPWTHEVVGAAWDGEMERQDHYFDKQLDEAYSAIEKLIGVNAHLTSWSRDRSRIVYYADVGGDAGGYYLYEPQTKKITLLGRTYPELKTTDLGQTYSIRYPARDGTAIPAFLTVPPGMEMKNLPTIILVHGGPWARDTVEFAAYNFWPQFLASRGYLVLQPQFRGSTGYGHAWEQAGYKQWGGLMQNDVDDGMDALVKKGFSDPKKVCIMGASYGGYAAMAGATLTPDRYACAVAVAGVSDLVGVLRDDAAKYGPKSPVMVQQKMRLGDPFADHDQLYNASPINHVAAVHVPVLLIHGTHDTVVNIGQTQAFYQKLKAAGKTVEFVDLPGDDHWLSRGSTRTLMLQTIEKFLANYMPATAPSQTSQVVPPGFPMASFAGSSLVESGGHAHFGPR